MNFVSTHPEFCGICGAILPLPHHAPSEIECRICHSMWHVAAKKNQLVCESEKIYERTFAVADEAEGDGVDSIVEHICTKCGHNQATYSTMQTRSADEGQTVFYKCTKCHRKDIEYS